MQINLVKVIYFIICEKKAQALKIVESQVALKLNLHKSQSVETVRFRVTNSRF